MRLSLYTHLFTRNDSHYLYNSETRFFSLISEDLYRQLYDNRFNEISHDTIQKLIKQKIIIKEEELFNYYNKQKRFFLSNAYNQEILNLVLIPTTGCNFECPYCFEGEKHTKTINKETISQLITFINSHEKANKLSLTWYGGEPLLALPQMQEILFQIKKECTQKIINQRITTNGYLINEKSIAFLKQNEFSSIQVTIDGTKEHHNQTRSLKNTHQPTFDIVLNNIKEVAETLPNCNIKIRININKKNAMDFVSAYKMIHEIIPCKNINIYPGFIQEETKDGNKLCYNSISEDYDLYSFYQTLNKKGINLGFKLKHANKGCGVNSINSYIIGPEGEIYKCWRDVNHSERIVGYIQEKKLCNETLFYNYLNETTPFENPECKNCLSFPICTGGCAWFHYKNKFENKQFNICDMTKNKTILENILLNMAEKKLHTTNKQD